MSSNRSIWRGSIIGAAALVTAFSATPASSARLNFDGPWSVLVVTEYGQCERAYRYGIEIANGRVLHDGNAGVQISGYVTPRGQVRVQVGQGDQQAVGTGRLSRVSGSGQWSGASPYQQCGGRWVAERRGAY